MLCQNFGLHSNTCNDAYYVHQSIFRSAVCLAMCAGLAHSRASVNRHTGVLYARKFDQNAKNQMDQHTSMPKIKWLTYMYAEK